MKRILLFAFLFALISHLLKAQIYTGVEGLLHTPSADMGIEKSLRAGVGLYNKQFVPVYVGHSHDLPIFYVALTPYKWVEASFYTSCWRSDEAEIPDRAISVKLCPIEEARWWPSVAIGGQDPFGSGVYTNYYLALTKHIDILGGRWGVHAAYRKYKTDQLKRWQGATCGLSFQPNFYRDLRATIEYTGHEVNAGLDVRLFRFLRLQGILQDGRYISGGLCVEITKL